MFSSRAPGPPPPTHTRSRAILRWALAFLILSLVAAFLGFGGVAATSAGIAKELFYLFLLVFLVTLVLGLVAGKKLT